MLLFYSAQIGSIAGMQKAIDKDPKMLHASEVFCGQSALHLAAASPISNDASGAVHWLLEKGVPWSVKDHAGFIPEDSARKIGRNEEVQKLLREWALQEEYEFYSKPIQEEGHQDTAEPAVMIRFDGDRKNKLFCKRADILYTIPHGAPDDELALIYLPNGAGIMMEWERPIMRESARLLLEGMPKSGLRILNIGFGLGMIDSYFQDAKPAEHDIIEGHPGSLGFMRHKGWYDRPGVRVLEERWQKYFSESWPPPDLDAEDAKRPFNIGKFDIVYFDTFQEGYSGHFSFIKHVPRLLRDQNSRFSYFNGHWAKQETAYEIYAEVQRLHHHDLGMNTKWSKVYIDKKEMWDNIFDRGKGVQQDYPHLIPICALAPTVPRMFVPGVGWRPYSDEEVTEDVDVTLEASALCIIKDGTILQAFVSMSDSAGKNFSPSLGLLPPRELEFSDKEKGLFNIGEFDWPTDRLTNLRKKKNAKSVTNSTIPPTVAQLL
ncbi:hypothetical protein M413DRAFT_14278 [Hebeloma cylindrosporum]|uniref:Uncharacterized protein n=1 Tax=Hebeloma cylindrosporum TaxID=76867 RepID=A0A0C3BGN0_HEBCY|nr:hypothetical protein M413DRAFT_14278 [Hebeloma cylindrosporum h7]